MSAPAGGIWVVRHGETEWSRQGRHTSVTDLDLTARGEEQARLLRDRLPADAFDLVLCSPRRRARRTAELAGLPAEVVHVEPDLVEWDFGDYEGRTTAEIGRTEPGWSIWTGSPPPGGEDAEQVVRRLRRVLDRVRGTGAERALLVAHGHALRTLAMTWLGWDLARGDQLPLGEARIGVLGEYHGRPALTCWNAPPPPA